MYRGASVGVVVPAYNEEGLVGEVIDTIPAFVDRAYVVDDCSTDATWSEIQRHASRAPERAAIADGGETFDPPVVTVRHDRNRGVGASIKDGYRRALDDDLDVVAVMNGDGQMDPAHLHRILDPVVAGDADYAKGDRLRRSDHRRSISAWRLFGNVLLTGLTRVASGYWQVSDTQNGYTAISADALDALDLDAVYDRYGFLNDLLVRLRVRDARIADVSMPAVYGDEESSIDYGSFVPSLSALLARDFAWRLGHAYARDGVYSPGTLYAGGTAGVLATVASVVRSTRGDSENGGNADVDANANADADARSVSRTAVALAGVVALVVGVAWEAHASAALVHRRDDQK